MYNTLRIEKHTYKVIFVRVSLVEAFSRELCRI